jgi:hypothetical protein
MKVYVLTYLSDQWDHEGRVMCFCNRVWEIEVYGTREEAEAAANAIRGFRLPKIFEKEMGV